MYDQPAETNPANKTAEASGPARELFQGQKKLNLGDLDQMKKGIGAGLETTTKALTATGLVGSLTLTEGEKDLTRNSSTPAPKPAEGPKSEQPNGFSLGILTKRLATNSSSANVKTIENPTATKPAGGGFLNNLFKGNRQETTSEANPILPLTDRREKYRSNFDQKTLHSRQSPSGPARMDSRRSNKDLLASDPDVTYKSLNGKGLPLGEGLTMTVLGKSIEELRVSEDGQVEIELFRPKTINLPAMENGVPSSDSNHPDLVVLHLDKSLAFRMATDSRAIVDGKSAEVIRLTPIDEHTPTGIFATRPNQSAPWNSTGSVRSLDIIKYPDGKTFVKTVAQVPVIGPVSYNYKDSPTELSSQDFGVLSNLASKIIGQTPDTRVAEVNPIPKLNTRLE